MHLDRARKAANHPYFECGGPSYEIAYGNMVHILASTLDKFSAGPSQGTGLTSLAQSRNIRELSTSK